MTASMDDNELVRRGYDELADVYPSKRSRGSHERAVLDEFLDSLSEPASLLDAGCGPEPPTRQATRPGASVVGLDLSRGQLGRATHSAPRARLVQGDMAELPFQDGTFDAVTAIYSVIHVPLDDHRTVFSEFARVLAPGGRVLVTEAAESFTGTQPDWLDSGVEMTWNMAGASATRDHLRDAGFHVETEWQVTDELAGEPTERPFFSARLDH